MHRVFFISKCFYLKLRYVKIYGMDSVYSKRLTGKEKEKRKGFRGLEECRKEKEEKRVTESYRVKQYTIHKAGGGESNRQIENLFLRAGVSNIYRSPDITVSLSHKHGQRIFSNDDMATQ